MTWIFRTTQPRLGDWIALTLFALVYIAAISAVVLPGFGLMRVETNVSTTQAD